MTIDKMYSDRAMFDTGIAVGKTMAAKEIITLIMEWEGTWSVMDFRDAIREKFGMVSDESRGRTK